MNRKAEELGCTDTHFVTPNGLDAEDDGGTHHTTAADLARIMRYCITESPKAEEFLKITQTDTYTFTKTDGSGSYSCTNHNAFLHMMDGALTGKTGFTGTAGYCYVGALQRDGKLLIVTLLACGWPNNKRYKWSDTRKLMEYGLEQFEKTTIGGEVLELDKIPVENGKKDTVAVEAEEGSCEVLIRQGEEITRTVQLQPSFDAPVERGQEAGYVEYQVGDEVYLKRKILVTESSEEIDYKYCLEQAVKRYLLRAVS
jgi:D-alanyl-D-alanine carboxypeptidase (penicillin-binding protein 5/6)